MDERDLPEVPPLAAADRLFVADRDEWMSNACLNFGDPEIGYVEGFRKAADLAVDHVVATGTNQDYLVYPIVFCYRQYLELRLKGLLRDSSRLLDEPSPSSKRMLSHGLSPLLADLRPLLERIFPGDAERLDRIGDRVAEFDAMDPDSISFRYATTKRGTPTLPADLRHINLARLREVMGRMAASLDGADVGIGVYLDNKAEMAEYCAEEASYYEDEAWADAGEEARCYAP